MSIFLVVTCFVLMKTVQGENERSIETWKHVTKLEGVRLVPFGDGIYRKEIRRGHGFVRPSLENQVSIEVREFDALGEPLVYHYQNIENEFLYRKGGITTFLDGIQAALLQMVEGDEWEIYVPSKLAYGMQGNNLRPHVMPGDMLIIKLKLIKIFGSTREPSYRCNFHTGKYCTRKELAYIDVLWSSLNDGKMGEIATKEATRLIKMQVEKDEDQVLSVWTKRRLNILSQALAVVLYVGFDDVDFPPQDYFPQAPIYAAYDPLGELKLHGPTKWQVERDHERASRK